MLKSVNTELPPHLQKYIVEQNYSRYTSADQAVWRYCLRQLKKFLSVHGHHSYLNGLEKTGIHSETIPLISEMSEHLQKFGWRAMPVSGFIPPATFMELQSLSILPIASDMRSIAHLLYTPAPDIVHEAAGHAPILADTEYADYLRRYSQVAKKSIISKEDLDLYEAIRELSDIKENPNSTLEDIAKSEKKLIQISNSMTHISEATQLSRMNWWTAEYGLIGDLENPKIYGAGLLSSVGESRHCLSSQVKKIPLTLDCIQQGYDITEPQPQLFVTPDFKTLIQVLNELSETMAYKTGGISGLDKAIQAESVNTVEFDSGFQISGVCAEYILDENKNIIFIKLNGASQICVKDTEIPGHGKDYHSHGYSTPIGVFSSSSETVGDTVVFKYQSGFEIKGLLSDVFILNRDQKIYRFTDATATYQGKIYFQPEWGDFDVITGHSVSSVFGGPADRLSYGETTDFTVQRVPEVKYSDEQKKLFAIYQKIRDLRSIKNIQDSDVEKIFKNALDVFQNDWLLYIELLEISTKNKLSQKINSEIQQHLKKISQIKPELLSVINDGILLAHE
jgi:phenylalanine-4-hydroxylase